MPVSRFDPVRIVILTLAASLALARPIGATMPPVTGDVPPVVAQAFEAGLFRVPPRPSGLATSTGAVLPPVWRVPVILVSFSDSPLTYDATDFDTALFDTTGATPTGSVSDYFRWASGGRLTVAGRVVATVQLPHDRFYYAYNSYGLSRTSTPHNSAGMTLDALVACSPNVNWSEFDMDRDGLVDMLWVVHQGPPGEGFTNRFDNYLWSITSRLVGYWSGVDAYETQQFIPGTNQHYRIDRFTILPEMSYFQPGQRAEIGTFCHEFGHALGLPDLYDTRDGGARNSGPGNWSLMGSGGYGGDGHSPQYPSHLGAWLSVFLGWAQVLRPSGDTPVLLPPLGGPGSQVLDLCFQGEQTSDHYLVETRRRTGFDRNLPSEGLVISHCDEVVIGQGLQANTVNAQLVPGLVLVEADGHADLTTGMNRGDAGDPFPGSAGHGNFYDEGPAPNTWTFAGAPTGVGVFDVRDDPAGMTFFAQVRAPGWQAALDRTRGTYTPTYPRSPAEVAVRSPDGTLYTVESETRAGHQQVVLRTRRGDTWDAGVEVSASSGDALDPALTRLGSDGVAVTWCDTRSGGARLYYRTLVRGAWSPETVLYGMPGESRSASIAADERGQVHVAWIHVGQDLPQVLYMRFPYLSPTGTVHVLSGTGAMPTNTCVAALTDGAVVTWVESRTWPSALWFVRCGRDSLPGAPLRVTQPASRPQNWMSVLADSSGSVHTLWIESGTSTSELHYQCRLPWGFEPYDTTLETSMGTISHARIARDAQGGLHVVFERSVNGVAQVRYRRCRPDRRWDASCTDVTAVESGAAIWPTALPSAPGQVTVLYLGYQGTSPRLMERTRGSDQPPATGVEDPLPPLAGEPRGRAWPNPVRAGGTVELRWSAPASGAAPAVLDVYDLLGRRVASVELEPAGPWLRARLGSDRTRGMSPGVYLVRARGSAGAAQRLVVLR